MWADPRIHSGSLPLFALVFKMIPSADSFSAQLPKRPDGLSKRNSPPFLPSVGGIGTFKAYIRCSIFRLVPKYAVLILRSKSAPSKVGKAIIRMLSCEEALPTEKEIQFVLVIFHFRQWLFTRTFVLNVIMWIDFKLLLYKNAFRANIVILFINDNHEAVPLLPWCVWTPPNSYAEDWPLM